MIKKTLPLILASTLLSTPTFTQDKEEALFCGEYTYEDTKREFLDTPYVSFDLVEENKKGVIFSNQIIDGYGNSFKEFFYINKDGTVDFKGEGEKTYFYEGEMLTRKVEIFEKGIEDYLCNGIPKDEKYAEK